MCRGKEGVGGFPERNKVMQPGSASMQGEFSSSSLRLHNLFPRGCSSPGVQAVWESSWLREVGSKLSEATTFCFRWKDDRRIRQFQT